MRGVLSAALKAPLRVSEREEAGAAGVAMMAAVAIGAYSSMDDCIAEWVTPLLGRPEPPDAEQAERMNRLYGAYRQARLGLVPVWDTLAGR